MSLDGLRDVGVVLLRAGVTRNGERLRIDGEAAEEIEREAPGLVHQLATDAVVASIGAWAVEWARCGLPQIALGHKLAASLMSTSMSREAIEDLAPPWPAFAVLLPSPLLFGNAPGGARNEIRSAHAYWFDGALRVLATDEYGNTFSTDALPQGEWCEDLEVDAMTYRFPTMAKLDDEDGRMLHVLGRLVLGVAAELSSPEERRKLQVSRARHAERGAGRASAEPQAWTYVLGRAVKVDARASVVEYVERGGRAPRVQSLVRGHWKRQVHGAGRAARKWIHVEPYWRGPEDAPIVVSPRRLGER